MKLNITVSDLARNLKNVSLEPFLILRQVEDVGLFSLFR